MFTHYFWYASISFPGCLYSLPLFQLAQTDVRIKILVIHLQLVFSVNNNQKSYEKCWKKTLQGTSCDSPISCSYNLKQWSESKPIWSNIALHMQHCYVIKTLRTNVQDRSGKDISVCGHTSHHNDNILQNVCY